MRTNVSQWKSLKSITVCLRVYLCFRMHESVFLHHIDRPAGKQLSPCGNSQPRFTSGCAKLSNYTSQLCQEAPLFLSIDGMTGLHPLTHTPLSPSLFLWCTCLPALQASSTRIKGAELFSSRKLIQHLSPGFILGIDCVLCECECRVCE